MSDKPTSDYSPKELEDLRVVCQEYIDFIWGKDHYEGSDYKHYIFEAAMKAIFGEDIFDIINQKIDEKNDLIEGK